MIRGEWVCVGERDRERERVWRAQIVCSLSTQIIIFLFVLLAHTTHTHSALLCTRTSSNTLRNVAFHRMPKQWVSAVVFLLGFCVCVCAYECALHIHTLRGTWHLPFLSYSICSTIIIFESECVYVNRCRFFSLVLLFMVLCVSNFFLCPFLSFLLCHCCKNKQPV